MIPAKSCISLLALAVSTFLSAEVRQQPKGTDSIEQLITEDINLPDIDGNQLAGLFEKFSGKKVIVSEEAAATRFTFIQKASSERPLSYRKAADLVLMSALVENFEFITDPKNPNSNTLRPHLSKGPGCVGDIKIYNKKTPLPNDDSVINYVMELRHVGTKEALKLLESKRSKSKEYAAIVAIPNSTAILIVDKISVVRQLIEMHSKFDQPSSNPKSELMPSKETDR